MSSALSTASAEQLYPDGLIAPGYYADVSNHYYHHVSHGTSSSKLKLFFEHETDARARHYWLNPEPASAAMRLGTAVHSLVLEPHNFEHDNFVTASDHWSALKTARDTYPEMNIITPSQYDAAQRMRDNVLGHPYVSQLMQNGIAEVSVWQDIEFYDEKSGCTQTEFAKCRIDWMPSNAPYLVDLKSAAVASPDGFRDACHRFEYYLSACLYSRIANQCSELMRATGFAQRDTFIFIVVENKPPYSVAWYEMGLESRGHGNLQLSESLSRLCWARKNDWPAHNEKCLVI
ncbi:PD-(D/E)XK nuclease-like domain-containing protein [uncultured Paraglaciecola sp.]|uniref:PD-(D/E)XK nuclease-like domain-containing protein n=1 Tax=uncultured Paraglaciecola sp. TaxID=1765024 RepID=UPI00260B3DC1|nr:PD-(D/E)XK nuclease-like domain-containing protein [uncultured Paraglaciecola sp.]